MKNIFVISTKFILIFFVLNLNFLNSIYSQSELWPTSNAEWYYTVSEYPWTYGYTKYKIERDTLIEGKNCQIYSRKSEFKFTGLPFDTIYQTDVNTHFIINLEDSVLRNYDLNRNVFDTIMNFKAEIGSRWFSRYQFEHCSSEQEPFYITKLIDKETENVNGLNLVKIKVQRIIPEQGDTIIKEFYQLFGGLSNFVFDNICFGSDFSTESLRCFLYHTNEQDEFNYKTSSLACNSVSALGINENIKNTISIHVINPSVSDEIRFVGMNPSHFESVQLMDAEGKILAVSSQFSDGTFIISPEKPLVSGIYFYVIQLVNGVCLNGKVLIN